jgi:hypothetical protein
VTACDDRVLLLNTRLEHTQAGQQAASLVCISSAWVIGSAANIEFTLGSPVRVLHVQAAMALAVGRCF